MKQSDFKTCLCTHYEEECVREQKMPVTVLADNQEQLNFDGLKYDTNTMSKHWFATNSSPLQA